MYPSQCYLGEGPVWNRERKSCFWVDIENGILFQYHWENKSIKSWKFHHKLSFVAPARDGGLILALDRSIQRFFLETEKLELITVVDDGLIGNRCNDGACDSRGRLWIGTMSMKFTNNAGTLFCINHQHQISKKIESVSISNGLAWSSDNRRLFYIDTPTRLVQSYLFDEETGEITFEKNVISIPEETGMPDGMTIDEEGMLWIAHWGGFGVYRWNPVNGKVIGKVELPVPLASSCAFAGEALDHLIITTARENMSEEELMEYPGSGDIFVAKMNVRGVAQNICSI